MTVDDAQGLIRRTRTDRPFDSIDQAVASYQEVLRAMGILDRRRYALLVDLRSAPPRNDPIFEQNVERHLSALYGGFRRVAVLVRTEAGRLQISRLHRMASISTRAFTDEAAAIAYLGERE
jgi:hypothetical protein